MNNHQGNFLENYIKRTIFTRYKICENLKEITIDINVPTIFVYQWSFNV